MTLGEMTDADKVMNLQHAPSDAADICIRIQIQIYPEMWMWIPDDVWLRLDAMADVCAVWAQSG